MKLFFHGAAPFLSELRGLLEGLGHQAVVTESAEEATRRATGDPQAHVVLGYHGGVKPVTPPEVASRTIVVVEDPSAADLAQLGRTPAGLVFGRLGAIDGKVVATGIDRRLHERGANLQDFLKPGVKVERIQITNSGERGAVLESFEQALAGRELDVRILNQLLTVVDELITNACFHAPIDSSGRRPFANRSRIEAVPCNERPIDFAYGWDDQTVAVAIRDHYGSLAPSTMLVHLAKAFGAAEADLSSVGAAIGLATAFRCASSLVFNLVAGKYTECIGTVDPNRTYKQFIEQGKSFELHYVPPNAGMLR